MLESVAKVSPASLVGFSVVVACVGHLVVVLAAQDRTNCVPGQAGLTSDGPDTHALPTQDVYFRLNLLLQHAVGQFSTSGVCQFYSGAKKPLAFRHLIGSPAFGVRLKIEPNPRCPPLASTP